MKAQRPIVVALGLILFCGILSSSTLADDRTAPPQAIQPARAIQSYKTSQEVTLQGVIRQVVTKPAPGSPSGLHLLIASQGSVVDAHLGPYLPKNVRDGFRTGQKIQVTGLMRASRGKQILLARQVVAGGQTIRVRSEHGFLVRAQSTRKSAASQSRSSAKAVRQ